MIFENFNFMIRKHIDSKQNLSVNLPTTIKQQILNSMLIKMICFCFDNFFFVTLLLFWLEKREMLIFFSVPIYVCGNQ